MSRLTWASPTAGTNLSRRAAMRHPAPSVDIVAIEVIGERKGVRPKTRFVSSRDLPSVRDNATSFHEKNWPAPRNQVRTAGQVKGRRETHRKVRHRPDRSVRRLVAARLADSRFVVEI